MESLQTYLLGQALSFALLKKGIEPLHATAVVINGQAVALLGDGGYGKSTLAAALLHLGHRLLTDDLLVLSEEDSAVRAQPGTPRLKLFPETAERLFARTTGTVMNPLTHKLVLALDHTRCHSQPVPLGAMYLLPSPRSRCSTISIRRVPQRRAFLALLKNTFNTSIAERARLQQQFSFANRVLAKIPVRSLRYPRNLELVPAVAQAIVADSERDR
ncbi:MAG TPA: hypothetical protein VGQ71_12130 [Terriglobales bacterium]|nr:hypothetical protein [Terriglobales bacterium]